jgi:hypothetical protein
MPTYSLKSHSADAGLIALAERCVTAQRARKETLDRLEVATVGRPVLALDTDADVRVLDAAYQRAADESDALAFMLTSARVTTLEGALAKGRALAGDDVDETERRISVTSRLAASSNIAGHLVAALKYLTEG